MLASEIAKQSRNQDLGLRIARAGKELTEGQRGSRGACRPLLLSALIVGLGALGCSPAGSDGAFSYENMPVATDSAPSTGDGSTVTFQGNPLTLSGRPIAVGETLADVQLYGIDQQPARLASGGRVKIISVVPSLDTPVCEQQTHYLSEKNSGLDAEVELVTVSLDTPFAQGRFSREAEISNVTFLSDNRAAEFGRSHGLLVDDVHILARTVMVVDADNVIRYLQVTPELTQMPDMEAAFEFARSLVAS